MLSTFNAFVYLLFVVIVVGSLLPLSSHPHWFIRAWDYPRVQIVIIAIVAAVAFAATNLTAAQPQKSQVMVIVILSTLICGWHLFRIMPYTPVAPTQADDWEPDAITSTVAGKKRLRVLMTNVEEENDRFDQWSQVVREADADVVIVAEVDDRWAEVVEGLKSLYPNQIVHPQDNWYGMAMLTRLPIVKHKIRFLVEDDVPSIDATLELPSGDHVRVIGVHPRPPEPVRDNDSTARDAELVLWGKELADEPLPIVIGGDLNDVAWSEMTRLFLRLSGLLDPRRGRGFFNSFHADHVWMRFPLDHVFHSTHFAIRDLQKMPHVGSDHFPIYIDLQLEPSQRAEHEPLDKKSSDDEAAEDLLERAEDEPDLDTKSVDEVDQKAAST